MTPLSFPAAPCRGPARRSAGGVRLVAGFGLAAAATMMIPASAPGSALIADAPAIVARVLPAVVSITTRHVHRDQAEQLVTSRGLGSGVIVDPRGFILTNNHVIEGAEQIKVTLPDERVFTGRLVGADPATDLAVIRIDGKDLPVAVLGDSDRLRVGEPVIAIGNPLWIEGGPTVTAGVVSGLGRALEQAGLPALHHLVQTDAAINEGNSGGPLVNRRGQVIGINTALIPTAHGIGFAIPISTARPVIRELILRGRIARPTLGIVAASVTPQVAFVNDLPVERGVLVVGVQPGGPGEQAGLRKVDVIVAVAGRPVRDLHEFHLLLWARKPGDTIAVSVRRDGATVTLQATLVAEGGRDQP